MGPAASLRRAAALVFVEDLDAPSLAREDAHHLLRVLRVRRGEALAAADGAGRWRPCVLGAPDSDLLEATGPIVESATPDTLLSIGFSLLPGDRTETVARQLTELGIDRIALLVTDRTVVRPTRALARLDRLQTLTDTEVGGDDSGNLCEHAHRFLEIAHRRHIRPRRILDAEETDCRAQRIHRVRILAELAQDGEQLR